MGVGLAVMVGHCWPLFLGFRGGRGVGSAMGMLAVLFPGGAVWTLGWVVASRLLPRAAAG